MQTRWTLPRRRTEENQDRTWTNWGTFDQPNAYLFDPTSINKNIGVNAAVGKGKPPSAPACQMPLSIVSSDRVVCRGICRVFRPKARTMQSEIWKPRSHPKRDACSAVCIPREVQLLHPKSIKTHRAAYRPYVPLRSFGCLGVVLEGGHCNNPMQLHNKLIHPLSRTQSRCTLLTNRLQTDARGGKTKFRRPARLSPFPYQVREKMQATPMDTPQARRRKTRSDLIHLRFLPSTQPATKMGQMTWAWVEHEAGLTAESCNATSAQPQRTAASREPELPVLGPHDPFRILRSCQRRCKNAHIAG